LVLPRILKLKKEYDIDIQFKLVYPLAIRQPEFFKGKNFFSFFLLKTIDIRSKARRLNMPFYMPNPDPIQQSYITGKINKDQPYIFDICHLGMVAEFHNKGIEFAHEVSHLIFGTKSGWNDESNLSRAAANVGLDFNRIKQEVAEGEDAIVKAIKTNQSLQQQAGHHGVPLMVYKDKTFFGQDRFDEFKELLLQEGLQRR
tara:strand:- start:3094 stop:3693 length:600 start_codon:yes stop_codon:yes gene_type:complete